MTNMDMDVPQEEYERIGEEISSPNSPVGIDAKKTHIWILHKLTQIERRLDEIEKKMGS